MTALRDSEIAEVDAFLAEEKRLRGPPPEWVQSARPIALEAIWIVEDELGVAKARLNFGVRKLRDSHPTVNLIFRGRPIWRVEIENPTRPHLNPLWVRALGLPPIVTGSQEHSWPDNRAYIGRIPPEWDIPARRPVQAQIRRLPQALAWFADRIGLTLDSDQRGFDVPPQAEMFE